MGSEAGRDKHGRGMGHPTLCHMRGRVGRECLPSSQTLTQTCPHHGSTCGVDAAAGTCSSREVSTVAYEHQLMTGRT